MTPEEISSLKAEHLEIRTVLTDFGESIAHIKQQLNRLDDFNVDLSKRQSESDSLIKSNAQSIQGLSDALKQHFNDEMEAHKQVKNILEEFKLMAKAVTEIQIQAKDRENQSLREMNHELDKVYSTIRNTQKDCDEFKTKAAKEHVTIIDSTEKRVMDRVFKHVTVLWAVGLVCGALVSYIFNEHVEDFDKLDVRHSNEMKELRNKIVAADKARINEHKTIFELGRKMNSNPYVEAELLKREHFSDGHKHGDK